MSNDREESPTSQKSFRSNSHDSPNHSLSRDWSSLLLLRLNSRDGVQTAKDNKFISIERSNLMSISKLIIKELIDQSLRHGRTMDSDHVSLTHFFIIMEHVLRHRLRSRPRSLLAPKIELWGVIQQIEKYLPEAEVINESVRSLPNIKTSLGRVRAWLRISLMQKKLTEYLQVLIDHKDEVLTGCYDSEALMLSDDAMIITGLLIGLNTIDCNLCLKDDDFDGPQGVIDFSMYLKPIQSYDETSDQNNDLSIVLDQKNFIEEINEHLKATVDNLQAKVESLTNSNVLIKKDLAVANNNLLEFQKNESDDTQSKTDDKEDSNDDLKEIKSRLSEERNVRQEVEKELKLQLQLKAEMEVAMKLLEKDIHDKQESVVSMRRQLDDIKSINLEMYKKLQNSEASVQHKTELIAKLEANADSMNETIQTLEEKLRESEMKRVAAEQTNRELGLQTAQCEKQTNCVEGDLKVEREWRISLQESIERDKNYISKLQNELSQLKIIAQKYAVLQKEFYTLKEKCLEQEQTMEELGNQLSTSKLQISDLKEEINRTKIEGFWADDSTTTNCKACNKEFNLTRRKHHCRNCGGIFCKACSDNSTSLPSSARPVRVCDDCLELLTGRNSVM